MANRKRTAVDRIPVDYAQPRRMRAQLDQGGDWGAMLALTPLTEAERAARSERARAVLRAYDAEDLADALGLNGEPERTPVGRERLRLIDVPCAKCDAKPGQYCASLRSGGYVGYHGDRRRRHEEMQQEAA